MTDLARNELVLRAEAAIMGAGGPTRASVHFKVTCSLCSERLVLQRANWLPERAECWRCGTQTEIEEGGFMLIVGDQTVLMRTVRRG